MSANCITVVCAPSCNLDMLHFDTVVQSSVPALNLFKYIFFVFFQNGSIVGSVTEPGSLQKISSKYEVFLNLVIHIDTFCYLHVSEK